MHDIQKHILKKLTLAKKAKYSELKPKGVEGNLFSYHLRSLVTKKYLTLKDGTYSLTSAGKHFVDRVSFETFHERIQPKIVTILVIKEKNKHLLYKRHRAPFINHIGFPYGKIHLEEHIEDAALRELKEKTGLEAKLKHRGMVYITAHDETELISHMLCHVFTGSKPTGSLASNQPIGECFFGDIHEIPKKDLIPGVLQIIELLKKNPSRLFFAEYFLNTSDED